MGSKVLSPIGGQCFEGKDADERQNRKYSAMTDRMWMQAKSDPC